MAKTNEQRLAELEARVLAIRTPPHVSAARYEVEELERELARIQGRLAELEPEVPRLEEAVKPYKQALDSAQADYKAVYDAYAGASTEYNNLYMEQQRISGELGRLRAQITRYGG